MIEQKRQELEEERQQIAQIRYSIDQQRYDIEVRQNKLIELEPFCPINQATRSNDIFRTANRQVHTFRILFLENIKEGKHVDKEIEEQPFKNGNREQHSVFAEHRYSIYMKRFLIHHYTNRAPITSYTWTHQLTS